jgi:hypothetical protein
MIAEVGIVQPSFSSPRITLIAGEFPLVGGTCFIPCLSKRKLPEGACPGSRGVGFRAVGEMIRMMDAVG